jgi:hypothetical protein
LESVYTGNRIVGSNPTPSASHLGPITSAPGADLNKAPVPQAFSMTAVYCGDAN